MHRAGRILGASATIGIFYGIASAAILVTISYFVMPFSSMGLISVNSNLLWMGPVADLALFLAVGAGLAAASCLWRRLDWEKASLAMLTFVAAAGLSLAPALLHKFSVVVFALGVTAACMRRFTRSTVATASRLLPAALMIWLAIFVAVRSTQILQQRQRMNDAGAAGAGRPNVLLLVLDTLRADHMSLYGYPRPTTPHLERFAREGTVFTRMIASSSWTLPSHASMFTGLAPSVHGAGPAALSREHATLAERFAAAGYLTGAFVANSHLAHERTGLERGFVHYEGMLTSFAEAARKTVYGRRILPKVLRLAGFEDEPGRRYAGEINRSFLDWLDGRSPRESSRPFFVFLNYMDVHAPYVPRKEFVEKLAATAAPVASVKNTRERDAYDAAIASLDAKLGELFEELGRRGLLDDTVIAITSDHGEAFGERSRNGHGTNLYREAIHVPLVIRFPGNVPRGARFHEAADHTALAATLLDVAGVSADMPGRSLFRRNCADGSPEGACAAVAELDSRLWEFRGPTRREDWKRSLVSGRWHLLRHADGTIELFDWENDAAEVSDRASTPEGRAAVAALEVLLANALRPQRGTSGLAQGQRAD